MVEVKHKLLQILTDTRLDVYLSKIFRKTTNSKAVDRTMVEVKHKLLQILTDTRQ